VARLRDLAGGSAFAEHLFDGIAGHDVNDVNQEETRVSTSQNAGSDAKGGGPFVWEIEIIPGNHSSGLKTHF